MKLSSHRIRQFLLIGDLRGASQSLGAKLVMMPVVALAGLFGARVAVRALGADGYAIYAIIVGLSALLPFSDLGIGAAVMDTVARRDTDGQDEIESVMVTSWRVLSLGAIGIAVIAWSVAGIGGWSSLLGTGRAASVDFATALALSIFALGLPLSIGPRLLVGAGRNHVAILVQSLAAIMGLALLLVANACHAPLWGYTSAPFVATGAANLIAFRMGVRITHLRLGTTIRMALHPSVRGARVRHIAGPMVVITVILPLAYQTDRLVLSHVSSLGEVASYSVALQLFAPLMGLVGSAGMALWPVYARQRGGRGVGQKSFARAQISFGMLGTFLAIVLLLLGPLLARFVGGSSIHVHIGLLGAFAALLLIQAISYPMAMFLTDARGLRFQAKLHIVMLAINLPMSVLLAGFLGATGPVLASVLAIMIALFLPEWFRTRRLTAQADLMVATNCPVTNVSP